MPTSLVILLLSGFNTSFSTPPLHPHCDSYWSAAEIKGSLDLTVDQTLNFDEIKVCVAPNHISYSAKSYYELDNICRMDSRTLKATHETLAPLDDRISKFYGLKDSGSCNGKLSYTDLTTISDSLDPEKLFIRMEKLKKALQDGNQSELSHYFDLPFWDRYIKSDYRDLIQQTKVATTIRFVDVSRYLLTNDDKIHYLIVRIDGRPWGFLAEITAEKLIIVSVSNDII